jgi:dienelactone hydrolase
MSMLSSKCLTAAALVGLSCAWPSTAPAEQWVKFGGVVSSFNQNAAKTLIRGLLSKPPGAGPFPAVVLLHSCLGLPADHRAIAETFAGWGYVALFVDDFATRGLRETCSADFTEGVADAEAGMAYLAKLPDVDAKRIAVIGYSQGADTALQLASTRLAAAGPGLHFKAAVAYYPPCANQADIRLEIPVLILIGKLDEVTPAADCELLAKRQLGEGPAPKLVVYPGAQHRFDDPKLASGKRLFGMWMKYDADAADRSKLETRDFLAAKLAR